VSSLLQAINTSTSSSQSAATTATTGGDSTGTSKIAQFLSKLNSLAQSNPQQFKDLTSKIATELKADAGQTTGQAADFLNNLADKFQTASATGSTKSITPHPRAHHLRHAYKEASEDQSPNDLASALNSGSNPIQTALQSIFNEVSAA
jgi:hypothetical protein